MFDYDETEDVICKETRSRKSNKLSVTKMTKFGVRHGGFSFSTGSQPSRLQVKKKLELQHAEVHTPSVEEILKIPELNNDGLSKEEVCDLLDKQIAERQYKHAEEMSLVDESISSEKKNQDARMLRMRENNVLRIRLENEIGEDLFREMFSNNLQYLMGIWSGTVESS